LAHFENTAYGHVFKGCYNLFARGISYTCKMLIKLFTATYPRGEHLKVADAVINYSFVVTKEAN